jgi:hypothetical protein
MITPNPLHTNRLAGEKSPYLLQHRHNPVDWHPWGEEAFAKARSEQKPVFLSIGYSTCHWCHVMERESFENRDVADFLNRHFVSIKVDREERPDVDKIYMTAVQAIAGQGGWPLSIFLTPDLKPFYGGTYYPPEPRSGLPGFLALLHQIEQVWQTRRTELQHSAGELHQRLVHLAKAHPPKGVVLTSSILHEAAAQFKDEYDPKQGGFGGAPKFPRPSMPSFLLRYGTRFLDQDAVDMVAHTCERMACGGICDQLGGGFARYSVDEQWGVPHFEKMLYDNAQLAQLYLDTHLITEQNRWAEVAREIFRYVLRDMTHPEGGFYSAEDADSEGKEGKFYCWTLGEIESLLQPEEARLAVRYYGITDRGNFIDHSDPEPLAHQNVLHIADSRLSGEESVLLESVRRKLFAARSKRVRPGLDDKILASWNGLMLGALARGYAILGDDTYRIAAVKNLAFIQSKLWDADTQSLYHRWRDGERDKSQLLDDYAFLLDGVLHLYEATLGEGLLEFAVCLAQSMLHKFFDKDHGGFWQTPPHTENLIFRVKEDYDGAEPSGNSVTAMALLKLSAMTGVAEYKAAADQTLRLFASRLQEMPQAVPYLLSALDFSLEEPHRIVIAGNPADPMSRTLLHAAHNVYLPNKIILGQSGPVEATAKAMPLPDGKPCAYVCTGKACLPVIQDPSKLRDVLTREP